MLGNCRPASERVLAFLVQDLLVDDTLLFVLLLGICKGAEPLVPLGLQGTRNQAIVGINVHEALPRQVGFVADTFDLLLAQAVGFAQAALKFLLHGQG